VMRPNRLCPTISGCAAPSKQLRRINVCRTDRAQLKKTVAMCQKY
jgi:hypothetical protein